MLAREMCLLAGSRSVSCGQVARQQTDLPFATRRIYLLPSDRCVSCQQTVLSLADRSVSCQQTDLSLAECCRQTGLFLASRQICFLPTDRYAHAWNYGAKLIPGVKLAHPPKRGIKVQTQSGGFIISNYGLLSVFLIIGDAA